MNCLLLINSILVVRIRLIGTGCFFMPSNALIVLNLVNRRKMVAVSMIWVDLKNRRQYYISKRYLNALWLHAFDAKEDYALANPLSTSGIS
jgi:hypothetical protein